MSMSTTCVAEITVTILCSLIVYCIYIAINRLYLHPLASFPGPRLAALTFWYECYYDVLKAGQYVFKIKDLHEQYGESLHE